MRTPLSTALWRCSCSLAITLSTIWSPMRKIQTQPRVWRSARKAWPRSNPSWVTYPSHCYTITSSMMRATRMTSGRTLQSRPSKLTLRILMTFLSISDSIQSTIFKAQQTSRRLSSVRLRRVHGNSFPIAHPMKPLCTNIWP